MTHKGVAYTLTMIEPGTWKWQFRIDEQVRAGKIQTSLRGLAERRAEAKIDLFLKEGVRQRPAMGLDLHQ